MHSRGKMKNGITEGVILKQLLLFFFPILLGTFFQQFYNTIDAIVVGRYVGKEALAAVGGGTGTLINLLVGFFVGLSSGAMVIISNYYGAGKTKDLSDAVHTAVALSVAGGAVIMIIGIIGAPYALKAMGTPPEVLEDAVLYMRIYFAGIIGNLIYNIGSGILRAVGDSKRPLYFLIVCSIINIVLDLLFVVGFGMGVAGVAVATLIAQTVSAGLVLITLMRSEEAFQLILKKIHFTLPILQRIIKIGIPAGLQSAMYSISNIIIQSTVNSFGTDTMASWTACGKIDSIFWMIMGAFGVSITTFVGQNFGAGKYDRMKKSIRVCMALACGAALLFTFIFYFFGEPVFYLFSTDTAVIREGAKLLRYMSLGYVTYVAIEIFSGAMRGVGDSLIPMLLTCFGVCVLRVIWIFTAVPVWRDIKTVIFSYPLTWVVTSILFIIYYLKGGWLKKRL